MKKIVKRRKNFRVNNPLAFGILCAMILILFAGVTYALAAGIIAPSVRSYQLANATPTPTATAAPVIATPEPTAEPAVIAPAEATPETSAEPAPTPAPAGGALNGHVIGIDPARGYSSKVQGVSTKVYANRLNYAVASLVKEKLEAEGATVVFSLSDVKDDKDSSARASLMNSSNVEFVLRLECNSVKSSATKGAIVWVPSAHAKQDACEQLGTAVLKSYIAATGLTISEFNGQSIRKRDDQTIFNETTAPVCMLIMGYISNGDEDTKLNDAAFQATMAGGIVKGIQEYLGQ